MNLYECQNQALAFMKLFTHLNFGSNEESFWRPSTAPYHVGYTYPCEPTGGKSINNNCIWYNTSQSLFWRGEKKKKALNCLVSSLSYWTSYTAYPGTFGAVDNGLCPLLPQGRLTLNSRLPTWFLPNLWYCR